MFAYNRKTKFFILSFSAVSVRLKIFWLLKTNFFGWVKSKFFQNFENFWADKAHPYNPGLAIPKKYQDESNTITGMGYKFF